MSERPASVIAISDNHLRHVVIRASAGSGKTHALSGRYLSLLASGEEPHRILATTFTRAAAGEIRDRLLKRLALASQSESAESAKARADLARSLSVRSIQAADAFGMLVRLSRQLHTMQIRTLDSFFATVVRTFAVELGLPPECAVIDENDDRVLRFGAMRLLLDERDPDGLIELLRLLTRGDAERSVTQTIDRTIVALHELWREAPDAAWQWMPEPQGLLSPSELSAAIDTLANCAIPANTTFAKARHTCVALVLSRDWTEFLKKGLGAKVAADDLTYSKKPIDGELLTALRPLARHAAAELVHQAREQTLATQALLRLFDEQYERLKRRQRVLTFGDLTHAMSRAEALGTLDDIGYRLDARIHHLLLDEFQDTSSAQWQALRGMCEEITAQLPPRRTFYCVGDVKQSIYGWRGASPEILDRLPSLLPNVDKQSLDRSYRSSRIVIEAVNRVFLNLPSNAAMTGDAAHRAAAQAWHDSYQKHDVAPSLQHAPGYVELRTIAPQPSDKVQELRRRRLSMAVDAAVALHRRDPRLRIALLTNTNKSVARLLFELGPAGRGVPVSGRGGGPLIDAPPVTAILDLLHLADHPDDTVAAFNVAASPLGSAVGFTEFRNAGRRWRLARDVRRTLLLDGYQMTIARWVSMIAPMCDARERRRAAQLVELAGVHDTLAPGLRTGPFIQLVEDKDVPDSQPAPIEVMTVHQAKGLEFDAVILPELDGKLRGQKEPMVVFDRDERTGAISRIARYANAQTQGQLAELKNLTDRTRARTVRERLAVLYVAMTRAKHGLYMIIDPQPDNERTWPATATGLLRDALAHDSCPPDAVAYQHGDEKWIERLTREPEAGDHMKTSVRAADLVSITFANDLPGKASTEAAVSPSAARDRALARSRTSSLRAGLQLTNSEGRERGTVIHALFERVEWLEEFSPEQAALLRVTSGFAPRRDQAWHRKQIAAFHSMLAKPAIAKALSRGEVDARTVRVLRELPFVRATDSGIQTGSIDRLVLCVDQQGRAVSATVCDFKTDAIVEESIEAQAETHREQLQMYREVVADMFGLAMNRIAIQVLLVGAGEVVTL